MILPDPALMVAGAAIAGAAFGVSAYLAARHRRRLQDMEIARINLAEHGRYLDQFLRDPDADDGLRNMLLDVSDMLATKDGALRILGAILSTEPSHLKEGRWVEEIETMRAQRPDLHTAFVRAVGTCLVAACHNWSETARMFDSVAARLIAAPDQETQVVARAAKAVPEPRSFRQQSHAVPA